MLFNLVELRIAVHTYILVGSSTYKLEQQTVDQNEIDCEGCLSQQLVFTSLPSKIEDFSCMNSLTQSINHNLNIIH